MTFIFLIAFIEFCFGAVDYSTKANSGLRNVMYYGDWSVWGGQQNFYPDGIAADSITHLNFAFMDFDSDGNLVLTDSGAAHENPCGHSVSWGDANAGVLPAFQNLRANHQNVRLGVSLGGWSKSGDFTAALKNNVSRANLVNQLGRFIEYNNFDFIDVDWEYPGTPRDPDYCDNSHDEGTPHADVEDGKLFIQFLQDLKAKENEMGKQNDRIYELTVALPAAVGKLEKGAQAFFPPGVTLETATLDQLKAASSEYITRLFDTIDFGNLMTYDLRGGWDYVSGHHTGLFTHLSGNEETDAVGFSTDASVSYLLGKDVDSRGNKLNHTIAKGVLPEKLVIGSAFYSRGWGKVSNNGPEPVRYPGLFGTAAVCGKDADQTDSPGAANAAPTTQGDGGRLGGVWPYGRFAELHTTYPGLKYYYDDIAQAPYFYNEDTGAFFTYDSPKSIAAKTEYVRKNGLGGIISWMASDDASTGNEETGQYGSGDVRNVLSKEIKAGLWGNTPLENFNIGAVQTNVSCVVTMGKNVNNGQPAYSLQVTNNFVNTESTVCLQLSAKVAGTIAVPKLIITVKDGVWIGSGNSYGSGTWSQEGNVVTDDLTSTWELKTLDPGETASISLPATGEGASVSDIVKIEIARSIYQDGKEVGRAVIYP